MMLEWCEFFCVPDAVRVTLSCCVICFMLQTLSLSYWAATISAFHDTYIVIMTIGIVTIVCLAISLFAIQTKVSA
jgi:hypothetical protein